VLHVSSALGNVYGHPCLNAETEGYGGSDMRGNRVAEITGLVGHL
jgi:hypothetical protein